MDIIRDAQDRIVAPAIEGLKNFKRLAKEFSSAERVVRELRKLAADDQEPSEEFRKLLDTLQITEGSDEEKQLAELVREHDDLLGIAFESIGTLKGPVREWSFDETAGVGGGKLSLSGGLSAGIEVDEDGEILDGAVKVEDAEALVRVGVKGELGGKFDTKKFPFNAPVKTEAAFKVGGQVSVDNYFLHQASDRAIDALIADIRTYDLPGTIESADDLMGARQGEVVIPRQWVQLRADGGVKLGGRLSWSSSGVSSFRVKGGDVVDETLSVDAGVSVGAHLDYVVEGLFDIVLARSPSGPDKVRVSLLREKTSKRDAGFSLSAEIGVEGIDRVGKAVLGRLTPKVEKLIASIEREESKYGNLRKLLASEVDSSVDGLLKDNATLTEIESWLKVVDADVDLKETLKDLVREQVLDVSERTVDKLQGNVKKVAKEFRKLVGKYRDNITRVQEFLEKAGKVKAGIMFSRVWHRTAGRRVSLSFEIDPKRDGKVFKRMIVGDFGATFDGTATTLEVLEGESREYGSRRLTSTLDVSVLSKKLSSETVLFQDWDFVISTAGDVAITVKSGMEKRVRLFRRSRTFNFLADTRVAGTMVAPGAMEEGEPETALKMTIDEWFEDGKKEKVAAVQAALNGMDVLPEGTDFVAALTGTGNGDAKRLGELSVCTVLETEPEDFAAVFRLPVEEIQVEFARALTEYVAPAELQVFDSADPALPLIAWPKVLRASEGPEVDTLRRTIAYSDSAGNRVEMSADRAGIVRSLSRMVGGFSRVIAQLQTLSGLSVSGDPRDVLARVKTAQWSLMKRVGAAAGGLGWFSLNYALFATMLRLLRRNGNPEVFVVVERASDEIRLVYEKGEG
jgi:hypothetical protein